MDEKIDVCESVQNHITNILRKMNLKAVLFDLDGTLVDTNIDFLFMRSEILRLAEESGVYDNSLQKMDLLGAIDCTVDKLKELGKTNESEDFYKEAYRVLREIEMEHAAAALEIPEANSLLDTLIKLNIRTCIVTRNCRDASLLSMEVTGIKVDAMITREDTKTHKPLPEPVLAALKLINAKPAEAIMVGDHQMDILSAQRAGCRAIGFLREDRPDSFFDSVKPNAVITSLGELRLALDYINR